MSERLGVSEFSVQGWEARGRTPEDRHHPAILDFLGYEPWPEPQTLGEQLRAERLRRGLSMKSAADLIGIDLTFAEHVHEEAQVLVSSHLASPQPSYLMEADPT